MSYTSSRQQPVPGGKQAAPLTSLTAHRSRASTTTSTGLQLKELNTAAARSGRTARTEHRHQHRKCEHNQELGVANEGRGGLRSLLAKRRRMATWAEDLMRANNRGGHQCLRRRSLVDQNTNLAAPYQYERHSPLLNGRRSFEPSTASSRRRITRGT